MARPSSEEAACLRRELKALARPSDLEGVLQLAGHAGLLAVTGLLVAATSLPWQVGALLLHGIVLVFLFAPLHETIHRTAFRSRRLNDAVAWICGLALLLPPTWFRAYHLQHHRFTQDRERDPELAAGTVDSWRGYLWRLTGLPYWRDAVCNIVRHAAGRTPEPYITPALHRRTVREARLFLGAYAAIGVAAVALGSSAPLTYWVLPALLGQPALRFYLMAEHGGCPLVPDMLRNSRTTRSLAPLRWLAWNMPYHGEHHAFPAIPFHALPAAHRLVRDREATRAAGYLAAHREIVAELG